MAPQPLPPPGPAARAGMALITTYQRLISPLLGSNCRFVPTCSVYTRAAIERFGLVRGGWLGVRRLVRCQPFCEGGFDPVPTTFAWWPPRAPHDHGGP